MKYFCTSDIHSFSGPLQIALSNAGFDKDNPEHILIVCGDIFDRGPDTVGVYEFLISLPEDRLVLVAGNHELLYQDLLTKNFPDSYDYSNGTVRTFCHIADVPEEQMSGRYWFSIMPQEELKAGSTAWIEKHLKATWKKVLSKVKKSEVTSFINSTRWVNYFETETHVFVHSFVPINYKSFSKNENWRDADEEAWYHAKWGNPYQQYANGLFPGNKTLVVGHWHTEDFFRYLGPYRKDARMCPVYDHNGLVALDACAAATERLNVYVIN